MISVWSAESYREVDVSSDLADPNRVHTTASVVMSPVRPPSWAEVSMATVRIRRDARRLLRSWKVPRDQPLSARRRWRRVVWWHALRMACAAEAERRMPRWPLAD